MILFENRGMRCLFQQATRLWKEEPDALQVTTWVVKVDLEVEPLAP